MNWSHILIEAYCVYDLDTAKDKKTPSYCINGVGNTGIHCLETNDSDCASICPYFGFSKAKSTIALTDGEGDVVKTVTFHSDELEVDKWKKEEAKWLKDKEKKIE